MSSNIVREYHCPVHPAVVIGQEREFYVFDGVTDNGEDYSVEHDTDMWECVECDKQISSELVE